MNKDEALQELDKVRKIIESGDVMLTGIYKTEETEPLDMSDFDEVKIEHHSTGKRKLTIEYIRQ